MFNKIMKLMIIRALDAPVSKYKFKTKATLVIAPRLNLKLVVTLQLLKNNKY